MKRALYFTGLIYLFAAESSHAAAGGDLLTIDKTIAVQLIIIIAAFYILNSLIFKPLLTLLENRKKLTTGSLDEAKELVERAEKLIDKYNEQIDSARIEANEQRAEIRNQGQQVAEKMIHEARQESQTLVENYKKDLESQVKNVKEKIRPEIEDLARGITSKVLDREV